VGFAAKSFSVGVGVWGVGCGVWGFTHFHLVNFFFFPQKIELEN